MGHVCRGPHVSPDKADRRLREIVNDGARQSQRSPSRPDSTHHPRLPDSIDIIWQIAQRVHSQCAHCLRGVTL